MRGEIAVVTGANQGIGREIARALAADGMVVYLGARDERRGRDAARELAAAGDVRFVQLDVTDQAQVDAAARRVEAEAGRLDVLVNNAGIAVEWGIPAPELDVAAVRRAYEVNVLGVIAVTRACVPLLRRSAAGRVVNLSSPLGSLSLLSDGDQPVSRLGLLAYSSSKAALNAVTVLYANALREDGIRVNAVSPGLVATRLNADSPFPRGERTPAEGARAPVALALLGADGPTGAFLEAGADARLTTVPW